MFIWLSKIHHPKLVEPNTDFDIKFDIWILATPFTNILLFYRLKEKDDILLNKKQKIFMWWFWKKIPKPLTLQVTEGKHEIDVIVGHED